MTYEVRLFARAKDVAGTESIQVELPQGATVADLRARLAAECPALAGLLERCAIAVNDEFADKTLILPHPAEVAVLPPVSGGCTGLKDFPAMDRSQVIFPRRSCQTT